SSAKLSDCFPHSSRLQIPHRVIHTVVAFFPDCCYCFQSLVVMLQSFPFSFWFDYTDQYRIICILSPHWSCLFQED
ncbi:hypothetical protein N303_08111, partial [Cuculus canorus]